MNCERMRELMNLELDAELPLGEASDFHRHLGDCQECETEYAQLARFLKLARRPPEYDLPPHYWDGIWHVVRERAVPRRTPAKTPLYRRPRLAFAAMTCSVLVAAIGVRLTTDRSPEQMALSEASTRHAIVLIHQPYSDPGLSMLAMSEQTVESYDSGSDDVH